MTRLVLRYAVLMVWRERVRFLPAVLAVGFGTLLMVLQFGVLQGTISFTSVCIDDSAADLFVAARDVPSIDLGHPIPEGWVARLMLDPAVTAAEPYVYTFEYWHKPTGGAMACLVVGTRMGPDAAGAVAGLSAALRDKLAEPLTIAVDESEVPRLGLRHGVGEVVEVGSQRVRVVGLVRGYKSIGGPFVFCSVATARAILALFQLPANAGKVSYLVARCGDPARAADVARGLRDRYPGMDAFTRQGFSDRTRGYWLRETKAGFALAFTSALGLLVGLVVTSQTLYTATLASVREFALLRAVGVPRGRIASLVLAQSAVVGVLGLAAGLPLAVVFGRVVDATGGRVLLPPALLLAGAGVTLAMAGLAGLLSLRAVRRFDPNTLLR